MSADCSNLTLVETPTSFLKHRYSPDPPAPHRVVEWSISSAHQFSIQLHNREITSQWQRHYTFQDAACGHMYNSFPYPKAIHWLCFSATIHTRSYTAELFHQYILLVHRSSDECEHSSLNNIHQWWAWKQ